MSNLSKYEDLVPNKFVSYDLEKFQLFTNESLITEFCLRSDTNYLIFDLNVNPRWYQRLYTAFFEHAYWEISESVFRQALETVCPALKDFPLGVTRNRRGEWQLLFNPRLLNKINGRKVSQYPRLHFRYRKGRFVTILPVYYFQKEE